MAFTLTPAAARFMRMMVRCDGGAGFRLSVSPGGCSGLSSDIAVLKAPQEGDAVIEMEGVTLFVPAESRILLEGVTVDFKDSATSGGLVFIDPKATGCAHTPVFH